MSDRFTRLFELSEGLYSAGSPVIVEAGVLLKDNQTGKIISQLKFRNVSTLTIKALMVGLSAYDISGKEIAGVDEYQYLDMNVEKGQVFGSDKAIVMPSNITRSVAIKSLSVIDINGNVHTVKTPMNALPGSTSLNTFLDNSGNLIEQYKLDVNEEAVYKPQKWEDMWQCSCGRWNKEPDCYVCRAKMNIVFSSCDIAGLTMRADERLELLRLKEEERLRLEEIKRAEKEAREREELEERDLTAIIKKYRTKRILALVGTILFAVISIFILVNITTAKIIPNSKYDSGINRMNSGDYESAVKAFTELDGYKNSKTLLSVCNAKIQEAEHAIKYADAMALMEAGMYEDAKRAFLSIPNYADSAEKATECGAILAKMEIERIYAEYATLYSEATRLLKEYKYDEAAAIFSEIPSYQDAKEQYKQCIYEKALHLIYKKDYAAAYDAFSEIAGYKDSSARLNKFHWRVSSFHFKESMFQRRVEGELKYKFDSNGQLESVEVVADEYVDNYIIENNIPVSATRATPSRSTYVEEYTYELEKDREYHIATMRTHADALVATYDHTLYGPSTDGVYYIRDNECFLIGYDTWIGHNTDYVADEERVTEIVIKDDGNSHIYLEWSLYYDNGAIDELPYLAMYIYKVTEFLI